MPLHAIAQLLAHQGGWDEILWIAGPLLIVGGLLWLANRRANALNDDEATKPGSRRAPAD